MLDGFHYGSWSCYDITASENTGYACLKRYGIDFDKAASLLQLFKAGQVSPLADRDY